MRLWLLILIASAPVAAQAFDPVEYFGAGHFKQGPNPATFTLSLPLTTVLPAFLELSSSGDGDFSGRFTPAESGLVMRADDKQHRSLRAAIDAGIESGSAQVNVVELDLGATIAWHLQAMGAQGHNYLVQVRHEPRGTYTLQLRTGRDGRYRPVPDALSIAQLELPQVLLFTLTPTVLSASFGAAQVKAEAQAEGGIRPGLAVSDGRARSRSISVEGKFDADWLAEAAQRQAARRALLRLREFASGGLLRGVAGHLYEHAATDLKAYSAKQANARVAALALAPAADRARELIELAAALPAIALAQHEAGIAALQAGSVAAAHGLLTAAQTLRPSPHTGLALAESLRRLGRFDEARAALDAARPGLAAALAPELKLLSARLSAARGNLARAAEELAQAAIAHPKHDIIGGFADSARALTAPQGLLDSRGPLGLRVLADVPQPTLGSLLARLAPYTERMRLWLPGLPENLAGTIVVYTSPVDYLNASLIMASDNLDNVAGMFLPAAIQGGPTILTCRGFGDDELIRTLVHELWHLAQLAAGGNAPHWVQEGMAVLLSAGRLQDGVLVFDRLPSEFGPVAESLDGQQLARATSASGPDFYLPGNARTNYLAAWALAWHVAGDALRMRRLAQGDKKALDDYRSGMENLAPLLNEKMAALPRG